MKQRHLVNRLILSLTAIIVLVSAILMYLNVVTQEHQLLNTLIVGADQLSRSITLATYHGMLTNHREAVHNIMHTVAQQNGIASIRIYNKEGLVIFSTIQGEYRKVDKSNEACVMCHSSDNPPVSIDVSSRARIAVNPDRSRELALITPIYNDRSCYTAACHAHPRDINVLGVLEIGYVLADVDREVAALETRMLTVTGIQIALIAIFLVFFARRFVEAPIRRLIAATERIAAMELEQPVEEKSRDELGRLAHAFNIMRERLLTSISEVNQLNQTLESRVEERTEQLKNAQKKLLQSNRLASLGQLSASVAHEINNPISGVLNLTKLMQRVMTDEGIPPGRVSEFKRYLSQVTSETSRVGRIVSDLLAFSRRSKMQSANANLNQIIRSTITLIDHKLLLSNVKAELQLDETLPEIKCNSSQIQQVVMNLVLNAAEAMQGKESGTVTISTRAANDKKIVALEVHDTGDGIPEENLSKIFDPFFTTKEEGKGVGLGLAVVYGIVESHNGEIEVASKAGEGTLFRVLLPVAGPPAVQQETHPQVEREPVG